MELKTVYLNKCEPIHLYMYDTSFVIQTGMLKCLPDI